MGTPALGAFTGSSSQSKDRRALPSAYTCTSMHIIMLTLWFAMCVLCVCVCLIVILFP